jgi:hypothetical protein
VLGTTLVNAYTSLTVSFQVYPVMLTWQSSDLNQPSHASNTAPPHDTSKPAAVSDLDSLPSGAKVGIGVAVGVAGLLIIATTVLLVRLRRVRIR